MFEFTYLWIFILLPLPLLARYFLSAQKQNYTQIWIPLAQGFNKQQSEIRKSNLSTVLPWLVWVLLLIALAKPIWFSEPIRLQQESRDMIISLDLSGSMQEVDMPLNGKTAIGESIALAIKRFVENKNEQRVLILLTDGANTAGIINPIQAAKQAAKNNITIYTVGIGADEMIRKSFWGNQRINPSADLDEKTLTEIAQLTGGQYFRARNQDELQNIYQQLNRLEPIESDFLEFRPEKNLFYWPLSLAILILFSFVVTLKSRGRYVA